MMIVDAAVVAAVAAATTDDDVDAFTIWFVVVLKANVIPLWLLLLQLRRQQIVWKYSILLIR